MHWNDCKHNILLVTVAHMFRWNLRDENYKLHKKIPGDEGFIFKVELSILNLFIPFSR